MKDSTETEFHVQPICTCEAAEKLAEARSWALREAAKCSELQTELESLRRVRFELETVEERVERARAADEHSRALSLDFSQFLVDLRYAGVLRPTHCKDCGAKTFWARSVNDRQGHPQWSMWNEDGSRHPRHVEGGNDYQR